MRSLLSLLAILVLGASAAPPAVAAPPAGQTPPAPEHRFQFQDDFWVNLHHFVRAEARRRAGGVALEMPVAALSETERATWNAALDAYADLAKRSLIFDDGLVAINNALSLQPSPDELTGTPAPPPILDALRRAAPIFRARVWPNLQRANDAWIERVKAPAEQHAVRLIPALAAVYHVTWPQGVLLVDTSKETGPTLAYTTGGPPGTSGHTTIAPQKAQDLDVALETLFHEASHVVDDQITRAVDEEAARQHVKPPSELWHALLFFTTGELVRRQLGKANDPTYQPYAVRFGVWERGWQAMHAALEKEWRPYLDGKASYESAVQKVVAACSTPLPAPAAQTERPPAR